MKKFFIFLPAIIILIFPIFAQANIFPNDAETNYITFLGNKTDEIIIPISEGTYTILYFGYINSSTDPSATINLFCGSEQILDVKNMNTNSNLERFDMQKCASDILLTTTSMGVAVKTSIKIIYVKYDLALVGEGGVSPTPNAAQEKITSGDNSFYISKQFDYGQILILTFLLIFFVLIAIKFLWNFIKQDTNEKL